MRLSGIILVSLALATASISTMIGISRYLDRQDRIAEDTALARLAWRQAKARASCSTDRCTLSILFPDDAGLPARVPAAPAGTDVLQASAAIASAEEGP